MTVVPVASMCITRMIERGEYFRTELTSFAQDGVFQFAIDLFEGIDIREVGRVQLLIQRTAHILEWGCILRHE